MKLPEINKTYNVFDDGKISESRRYEVTITEIIPFDQIDDETLSGWKVESEGCYWLYKKTTDYFIKAIAHYEDRTEIFVRTIEDEWFSLGDWSGILDIDGSLNDRVKRGVLE